MKFIRNKKSITLFDTLVIEISIFMTVNIIRDLTRFPLTLLLGAVLILNMTAICLLYSKKEFVISFLIIFLLLLFSLFTVKNNSLNFRYFFNWFSMILILFISSEKYFIKNIYFSLQKNRSLLILLNNLFVLLIFVMLFLESCYSTKWYGLYFSAFTVPHAVAASICLYITFEFAFLKKISLLHILKWLTVLFAYLQTGARTYLFSIIALILMGSAITIKRPRVRALLLLFCFLSGIPFLMRSSIFEKLETVLSYQRNGVDWMAAFTSGRSVFWIIDIKNFFKEDILHQIIGMGFDYSRYINTEYYGMNIWSHSLFIETLLSFGYIGLSILLYMLIKLGRRIVNHKPFTAFLLFILYIILIGAVSGLMDAQNYCFSIIIFVAVMEMCMKCQKKAGYAYA